MAKLAVKSLKILQKKQIKRGISFEINSNIRHQRFFERSAYLN